MMRINAIVLTGMLLMAAYSEARVVEKFTQNKLLERSDVVVIGRLEKCQDAEKTEEEYADSYVARHAIFIVESVFKGEKVQDRVTLLFYRLRTPQDDLNEGKTPVLAKFTRGEKSYRLAEIPDYPPKWLNEKPDKSKKSNINAEVIADFRISNRTDFEKNPVYLLYLKRAENREFVPVSGIDSWQSVYEIRSTEKR